MFPTIAEPRLATPKIVVMISAVWRAKRMLEESRTARNLREMLTHIEKFLSPPYLIIKRSPKAAVAKLNRLKAHVTGVVLRTI